MECTACFEHQTSIVMSPRRILLCLNEVQSLLENHQPSMRKAPVAQVDGLCCYSVSALGPFVQRARLEIVHAATDWQQPGSIAPRHCDLNVLAGPRHGHPMP